MANGSPRGAVVGAGSAVVVVVGSLLGQGLSRRLPSTSSTRILLAAWMVFSLVLVTAYRANLIASLAIPKYPPRPETLHQLVKVVYRITMPSYGAEFQESFKQSESQSLRAMGEIMHAGVSVMDGLQQATRDMQAHMDGTRYLEQMIAEHFTMADGSTQLYVGREQVLPGLNAWPMPHDAPYKYAFDRVINVVQETGLYDKWMKDILQKTRQEGRKKQLQQQQQTEAMLVVDTPQGGGEEAGGRGVARALTVVHLQGPLLLLLLGLTTAALAFVGELLLTKCSLRSRALPPGGRSVEPIRMTSDHNMTMSALVTRKC